jgi:hypothetical protein
MLHPAAIIIHVCANNTVRSVVNYVHRNDGEGLSSVQEYCNKSGKHRVQKFVYVSRSASDVGCSDQRGLRDKPSNFLVDIMLYGNVEIYWINQCPSI